MLGTGWTTPLAVADEAGPDGSVVAADPIGAFGVKDSAGKSPVDGAVVIGVVGVLTEPVPGVVLPQAAVARVAARTLINRCFTGATMTRVDGPAEASDAESCPDHVRPCQAERVPEPRRSGDSVDELDARLLRELDAAPRVGVLELSRRLGVARGTVQARLDRLVARGVIASFAPVLDPEALGFAVTAFATLEIRQGRGADVLAHLHGIPEVLEVHTITGAGDMLCRVVARSNADLQRVLDRVTEFPEIVRTSTVIALSNPVPYRVLPLV